MTTATAETSLVLREKIKGDALKILGSLHAVRSGITRCLGADNGYAVLATRYNEVLSIHAYHVSCARREGKAIDMPPVNEVGARDLTFAVVRLLAILELEALGSVSTGAPKV